MTSLFDVSTAHVMLMSHLDSDQPIRLSSGEVRLVVVQDELQKCPYRESTIARMPLRLPIGRVTPEVTDLLLEAGYRRSGDFVYRTECPSCSECKSTRVDVDRFRLTKSMKRVLSRADRDLQCEWGPLRVDDDRVQMFNDHRRIRQLGDGTQVDADSYRSFLGDSCCESLELTIRRNGDLVGVSIMDVGGDSTSAVYTHFSPDQSRYSLGTLAVLKQIQWAIETNRKFVYLGMYVAENNHLNYKSRFTPQQRLMDGQWIDFDSAPPSTL